MHLDWAYAIDIMQAVADSEMSAAFEDAAFRARFMSKGPDPKFERHCVLLDEGGFIKCLGTQGGPLPVRLTYDGHEFLANWTSDGVKERALKSLKDKGLPATLFVLREISRQIIASRLSI